MTTFLVKSVPHAWTTGPPTDPRSIVATTTRDARGLPASYEVALNTRERGEEEDSSDDDEESYGDEESFQDEGTDMSILEYMALSSPTSQSVSAITTGKFTT